MKPIDIITQAWEDSDKQSGTTDLCWPIFLEAIKQALLTDECVEVLSENYHDTESFERAITAAFEHLEKEQS